MIVADANLLAYLVLPGERTTEAEAVFARDPSWAVPLLWVSELRSALGAYVRRGELRLAEAVAAIARAEGLVAGREAPVESRAVLELSRRSRCSTYDCEYVALAMSLDVLLVTSDRQVLSAFPKVAITPAGFGDGVGP
ncbi:MAG TPA: type II toxin-antitoxin system VapC family toxin [Gemmatimonadales bacterium]|nr:type II toxin-antitoxin system VapC family toxin [Gemmatimonadales bacterium]